MNKSRRVLVAALGTMTPALLVEERAKAHVADQAGAVEIQHRALNIAPDKEAMKSALLALSPADKLRIAGDRIRLAKAKRKKNAAKGVAKREPKLVYTVKMKTCVAACSGMLFAWK